MKELRKTITVFSDSTTTGITSFSNNIYVPFAPNKVIVKSISFQDFIFTANIIFISSDIIFDDFLCAFRNIDGCYYINNVFDVKKPINGTFNFNFFVTQLQSTNYKNYAFQGKFAMTLEFIKDE